MLPAIVIILFFIGALIALFGMQIVYAIDEHSKRDWSSVIAGLWVFVAIGGVICGWQTLEVLNRGASFG